MLADGGSWSPAMFFEGLDDEQLLNRFGKGWADPETGRAPARTYATEFELFSTGWHAKMQATDHLALLARCNQGPGGRWSWFRHETLQWFAQGHARRIHSRISPSFDDVAVPVELP